MVASGCPASTTPGAAFLTPDLRSLPQNSPKVRYQTVTANDDGQRIDNFLLAQLKGVPRSHVYRLISSGQVRRNGGRVKPKARLAAGDEIRIPPVRTAQDKGPPPAEQIARAARTVILDDGRWVGVDKPAGMPVHAGSGVRHGLIECLRAHWDDAAVDLCHRLDRDTSGALLIARRRADRRLAMDAFKQGRADKTYLAVLHGELQGPQTVDLALDADHRSDGERTVVPSPQGKPACSHFEPLAVGQGVTLAKVRIETGRTHQIRVHAASLGLPVAGDRKYGDAQADQRLQPGRMCLHAAQLTLRDAQGELLIALEAPEPPEFRTLLERP